jgi:5-methyltetrahydropteroyltriglutamate--homocysteine methyltransferase
MTFTMHLCRGNRSGMWAGAGGYEPIAERLFHQVPVDGFFLEYDTERAGDLSPLRHLPKGKVAMLGMVSTKSTQMESVDDLARRIDEATRHVALDQLGICPQCGFGSSASRDNPVENPMTEDVERRKLALLAEVAEKVWG